MEPKDNLERIRRLGRTLEMVCLVAAVAVVPLILLYWAAFNALPADWTREATHLAGEPVLPAAVRALCFLAAMGLSLFGDKPDPVPAYWPFVRKRLSRLCPQYYLAVLVLTAASVVIFRLSDWTGLAWAILSHLLFLDPLEFPPFYSNMAAYWWLGLLFQFTLVYPWLARLATRTRLGPGGLCVVTAVVSWPVTAWMQAKGAALPGTAWEGYAFLWTFNLPARLPEFCCGLWMAKAFREHRGGGWPFGRGLTGFLVGGCLFVLVWNGVPGLPPLGHMIGVVESLLVFAVLFALPSVAALGRVVAVRRIATLSYGIYLCHQPLISFFGEATMRMGRWSGLAVTTVTAGLASLIGAMLLARGSRALAGHLGLGRGSSVKRP